MATAPRATRDSASDRPWLVPPVTSTWPLAHATPRRLVTYSASSSRRSTLPAGSGYPRGGVARDISRQARLHPLANRGSTYGAPVSKLTNGVVDSSPRGACRARLLGVDSGGPTSLTNVPDPRRVTSHPSASSWSN